MAVRLHCILIASGKDKEVVRSISLKDLGPMPKGDFKNEAGEACWFYDERDRFPKDDENYCPEWTSQEDGLVLSFDTGNQRPSYDIVCKLSKKYPSVRFELRCSEPMNGLLAWVVFRDGCEMAKMEGYDAEYRYA